MKKATPQATSTIGRIFCSSFGHNYKQTKKITNSISEYRCKNCGEEVTETLNGNLELLTPKIKDVNSCLSTFFEKKNKRIYPEVS